MKMSSVHGSLSLDSVYAFVSPLSVFRRFILQPVFHTSTRYNTLTSVPPCAARAAQAVSATTLYSYSSRKSKSQT